MIIIKDNYYLYIENLKDINLSTFKVNKKINIIFRNPKNFKIPEIMKFKKKCKTKKIKLFIANDCNIAKKIRADGLYISAYNKKKYYTNLLKIGSAHNLKEINEKKNQNCKTVIVSRLFKTEYPNKKSYLGVLKFNLLSLKTNINIIPLGGINYKNLLKLNIVRCNGSSFLSALKKKPAILRRLF